MSDPKFIRDPTDPIDPTCYMPIAQTFYWIESTKKTENSTGQGVAQIHLKIDGSIIQVVYYLNVEAAGSNGLT